MSRRGYLALWVGLALGLVGFGFRTGPPLPVPVQHPTVTPLPDGRLLIVGGFDGTDTVRQALIYEPWTGTLTAAASTIDPHHYHTATLLDDGTVLVVAGKRSASSGSRFTERYDVQLDRWSDAGLLEADRERHVMTRLLDGRVLVFGDFNGPAQSTGELFDGRRWARLDASVPAGLPRTEATATRLPDGRVLFAGGGTNLSLTATDVFDSTFLYDPSTNAFSPGPTLAARRREHATMLLVDGGLLHVGGQSTRVPFVQLNLVEICSSLQCTARAPTAVVRDGASLYRLADGRVAVVGGTFGAASVELLTGAPLSTALAEPGNRIDHVSVPTADGRLLLVGGSRGGAPLAALETLELRQLSVRDAGPIAGLRERHTATLLPDGRVMLAGGTPQSRSLIYVLRDGGLADGGQLVEGRGWHGAHLLQNGDVLLVGGQPDGGRSTERCKPDVGCFPVGDTQRPRYRATSVLLHDGRVLVVGGSVDLVTEEGLLETFDPATNQWSDAGALLLPRHNPQLAVLPDGVVLITSGYSALGNTRLTELYDPRTGAITAAGLSRFEHNEGVTQVLPGGRVLLAGGFTGVAVDDAELWDRDAGWIAVGRLTSPKASARAIVWRDDRALLVGGLRAGVAQPDLERFEFLTRGFEPQPALGSARLGHSLTLLPSGEVLVAGGWNPVGPFAVSPMEIVRLGDRPHPELQPVLDPPAGPLQPSLPVIFTGQRLRGLGEASVGSYRSAPNDVPVFRFERVEDQAVTYATVLGWAPQTARVRVPATLGPGWYQVTAIVAGVSSDAVLARVELPDLVPCATSAVCQRGACRLGVCGPPLPDAGPGDAGALDAGDDGGATRDAGDDGGADGGLGDDAGTPDDAGVDGGFTDDGGVLSFDGGRVVPEPDGGLPAQPLVLAVGCGCGEGDALRSGWTVALLLALRRRRR